jgi:GTPase SAR1 family protein
MRIGLTGTMSCGKTTLVNALKELPEFENYNVATERSKYLRDLGIPLNTDSTLKGQTIFLAERASELLYDNIITDRTVIDVISFTKTSKSINYLDKEDFINYAKNLISEYDYIFYVSPKGVEIEDNSIREINAEYRDLIDFTILNTINQYNHRIKNLHHISGSIEERIQTIRQILFS